MSDEIKEVKTKLSTIKKADLVKLCEELIEKNENLILGNNKLIASEKKNS